MTFSKLPLVAHCHATPGDMTLATFIREWKQAKTVYVRTFTREVRAGGLRFPVEVAVVRRRPR